jgi:hypothetical protein
LSPEEQQKALQLRSQGFERVPEDGAVITIGIDPTTGQGEEFNFPNTDKRSVDSSEDGRLIRMLFAASLNLPLLLLGDGEDATQATGTVQLDATIAGLRKRQRVPWAWLQAAGRNELKRRYGPAQTYRVDTLVPKGGGVVRESKQVTADMLELPVNLPEITADDAESVLANIAYARSQGWLSGQTGAGMLGIDLLQELEQLATEGGDEPGDPREDEAGAM